MEKIDHLYSLKRLQHTLIVDKTEEIIPVTISYDPSQYIPPGSPGIVSKKELLKNENLKHNPFNKDKLVSVVFPFPTKVGNSAGICIKVYNKTIHLLPQKNLVTNHKVKIVNKFKENNLYDIQNYVTINGAITFVISDLLNAYDFLANISDYLCSKYKYTTFFNHLAGAKSRASVTDKFVPFISFIDIPYCIPLFDYRKVGGMGIYCGFMYKNLHEKDKKTVIIDTLCFVMSNHQTNLLYLDGVTISTPTKINTDVLKYMLQTIKNEIDYKPVAAYNTEKQSNKKIDKQVWEPSKIQYDFAILNNRSVTNVKDYYTSTIHIKDYHTSTNTN